MKELVLQDIILNQVRRDKSDISVKISGGETVSGTIRGFDTETLIMDTAAGQMMIYKNNILYTSTAFPVLRDQ
jgi:host factor-I protein